MTARRPRQTLLAIIAGLLGVTVAGCSAAGSPTASGPVTGAATAGPTSVTDSPAPTAPETSTPPAPVAIPPGARAYAIVAKYRCDIGESVSASTITVVLPHTTTATTLALRRDTPQFVWCTGQPNDPGNILEVSPIGAREQDVTR